MRKISWGVGIILGIMLIAACGVDKESKASSDSQNLLHTTIIGGRVGGAWSVFAEGIAESVRRENNGAIITVEPGGIVENPPAVAAGIIPFGLSYAMTSYAAYSGNEPYNQPYEDLRAVSVVIPANYYQFIVASETSYDSFSELIEQKVPIRLAVDQKGSAGEIITRTILQQYDVTYDDIRSWGGSIDYLSGSKTFEMMADRRIDAAGDAVSAPSSDIIEASTTMDLKLLPLNQETIHTVSDELGMEAGTIKKKAYDFLETNVETISTPAILITHKDVAEGVVYRIVQSIYENVDYLSSVHEEFKNLTAENMIQVGKIPLHPGAEKFFREKGLID